MQPGEFPESFIWGTATASYQVEGAVNEDGRSPSIWDTFSHTPGKTFNGDTGDVACDHYHRWEDDIRLMQQLGMQAYRFSIAWPRVLPNGFGQPNIRGLDFYDRLVDGLLAAHITPFVTLYHWDLPQVLQDKGGWTNRDTVEAFVEYTTAVVERLGDRVHHWITHNEPWCSSILSHLIGEHAPGWHDQKAALQAAHHILLSHGRAVPVLRSARPDVQVGITLNLAPAYPQTESEADRQATHSFDGFFNRWFLDPVFGRGYPEDMLKLYEGYLPDMQQGDLDIIGSPIDFLGVNYYNPTHVRAVSTEQNPLGFEGKSTKDLVAEGKLVTEMGWEVAPDALNDLLQRVHQDYNPRAIYITENGAAFDDTLEDGEVNDDLRVRFLHDHFLAANTALQAGVPLRGYFVWSLMDNFEWAFGYSKRFGIVYVDYETQERTLKRSARWYAKVIAENKVLDPEEG